MQSNFALHYSILHLHLLLVFIYEIFEHFRNSVVHNNFKCEGGTIYLKDYNEQGTETARFVIPYEIFEVLIEEQSKYASRYLKLDFPGNPGDNHDEATNVHIR